MVLLQTLLLFIGMFFAAYSRDISARKNGMFYGKKNPNVFDPKMLGWIRNAHIVTNQGYRSWWMSTFAFLSLFFSFIFSPIWMFVHALVLTTFISASVSDQWQKWINLGSGLPAVDPNEKRSWEFTAFGKSYWIPKFWYGERRIIIAWVSRLAVLIYTLMILFAIDLT